MTLEEFAARGEGPADGFDAVVTFHCLEHVQDPKGLIAGMSRLLSPQGRIFVSTPYSPMSFEGPWFDPLNHPPHHLSRWNQTAYKELGRQTGLRPMFRMPLAEGSRRRVVQSFGFALRGRTSFNRRRDWIAAALRWPTVLATVVGRQLSRERVNGVQAADVVLVEFLRA